ncbi:hypothetical protein [Lancefieldella rimae]|uniref:hypothetical protein n=1 Tax=Lancefieldella rimae TaxID=1383 RepID=UPI0028E2B540|nr:hypothetical protein [Lancefieldella rimae]
MAVQAIFGAFPAALQSSVSFGGTGSTDSSGSSTREEDGRASRTKRSASRQRQNILFLWYGYPVIWIRPATWCVDEQQRSA